MISYLQANKISRRIGDLLLFENIDLNLNSGDKAAIIAVNGAGKSSMLDILCGKESPDSGSVILKRDLRISYLQQSPLLNENNTILDELFNSENELVTTIKEYEKCLLSGDEKLIQRMIGKMDDLKAWDYEVQVKQILFRLKLSDLNTMIMNLSGGQKKRVALAKVLVSDHDLIVFDEPTNHLDLDMIEWLEEYLSSTGKTLLMVTHDRYFLDRVCNVIFELSDGEIYRYEGNYEYFLEKKQDREFSAKANVEKARNILRTELEWMRRMPKARRHKSKSRIDAFYDLKERGRLKADDKQININVGISRMGKKILEINNISKAYGENILIKDFSYKFMRFEKAGLVGRNGTGKSTLLNIITGLDSPDKGEIVKGETIKFGYYRQDGITFDDDMTVIDAVKKIAESATNAEGSSLSVTQFLNMFLFPPSRQYTFIKKLSGGEKRRLYLLTVLIQNPNFLILDEPTNDLDILTLNVLEEYLTGFKGCVIVVSHDRYFMDKVVDHIFEYKGDGIIKDFPGNYTQLREKNQEKDEIISRETKKPYVEDEDKKSIRKREKKQGLSHKEKMELELLETDLRTLGVEKKLIEEEMNSGILNSDELYKKADRLGKILSLIDEEELKWLDLSEKES